MPRSKSAARRSVSSQPPDEPRSIIKLDNFIVATRDSGYKGTTSAIAELVDNSLQAGARQVQIWLEKDPSGETYPLVVAVQDDGHGMDAGTLRQALRFGGSSRFNDRSGTGRYGMGLPNSSLSQARFVAVYTWRRPGVPLMSYLDVDEIAAGEMTEVPEPKLTEFPSWCPQLASKTGTLVVWQRCDRLDNRRVSTLVRKLEDFLGRVFRYRLWDDLKLTINGKRVRPIDPLFLRAGANPPGASLFGDVMEYELQGLTAAGPTGPTGKITVRFTELPVEEWHELANTDKRERGILDQPVVSVVRGDREIDRGWFFMGAKRRENYDDWWRCEVRFDPALDEWFGITHTKQQVRPTQDLLGVLSNDMEAQARALNLRVRHAHQAVKARADAAPSEKRAAERERLLTPLPQPSPKQRRAFKLAIDRHPTLKQWAEEETDTATRYAITEGTSENGTFFELARDATRVAVILNRAHPFYKRLYAPLVDSERSEDKALKAQVELLLIAAARAEARAAGGPARDALRKFREEWSMTLATYLRG
jgi:hypothetical protein